MNLPEINNKMSKIASEWEQFKSLNDRKEKEIVKNGSADPITLEQLQKLNNSIDENQLSLNKIETALSRPRFNAVNSYNMSSIETKHQKAFHTYLKKGMENDLMSLETKGLNDFGDAGYSITHEMSSEMQYLMETISPMLQICNVVEISTDALELIGENSATSAKWTNDFDGNPESKDAMKITRKTILAHCIYSQPEISQSLIDDPRINIESWITKKLAYTFASTANHAFINGDGLGKPMGILSYKNGKGRGEVEQISSGVAGNLTIDSLLKLYFSINEKYASNAKFLMSRSALQSIRMLKDKNEQYVWHPSGRVNIPDKLFGAPMLQSSDMPQLKEGSLPVAFGDFSRFYTIVKRGDVRILRDNLTSKPHVKFFSRAAIGGDVDDFSAVKLLKIGA